MTWCQNCAFLYVSIMPVITFPSFPPKTDSGGGRDGGCGGGSHDDDCDCGGSGGGGGCGGRGHDGGGGRDGCGGCGGRDGDGRDGGGGGGHDGNGSVYFNSRRIPAKGFFIQRRTLVAQSFSSLNVELLSFPFLSHNKLTTGLMST